MARNKNLYKDSSEDQLTSILISNLKSMAFDARHDQNVGGHCDIIVEGDDNMIWLGEAKIYTSYTTLLKGFRQLLDRYSTGLPRQDKGSLIIYSRSPNTAKIMKNWHRKINEIGTVASSDLPIGALQFVTEVTHKGSGRMIKVNHVAAVLYHEPTDS